VSKKSYRDLLAWQAAMNLVDAVYDVVPSFPKSEIFVLSEQMRKAAISIPLNIAEGQGRFNDRDFRSFLRRARASELELETQILIALRRRYVDEAQANALLEETARVGSLIKGLIRFLSKRLSSREPQTTNHK
jgi:four helix bundle protein